MTVITTVISKCCTAHASDSLITIKLNDGKHKVVEQEKSKIVSVRHWRGIMSCWGLAKIKDQWTVNWLKDIASQASEFAGPEEFAIFISNELNVALSRMNFSKPLDAGLGIHLTAYEDVDGYRIPELFQITNFKDPSTSAASRYQELHREGVKVRREAYEIFAINNKEEQDKPHRSKHGLPEYRQELRKYLDGGGILVFNNGDTRIFNAAISGILAMFEVTRNRRILNLPEEPATFRKVAWWPIDQVCRMQKDFVKEGYQLVGGKRHNLSVTPSGEYDSDTGDSC